MVDQGLTEAEPAKIIGKNVMGMTAVVTGANGGIGYHTALHLAESGMVVILACREQSRAVEALRRILAVVPDAKVEFSILNLASLASVQAFAERTSAAHKKVDILVNNAAVMAVPERTLSADGFELQLATNHLGHFALTSQLLPLLLNSNAPRVVTVSSIAHRYGKLNFDDLQGQRSYEGWSTYGTTKLANLLFSYELARRAKAKELPLMSLACHPGVSKTNILNSGPRMGRKVLRSYVSDLFAHFFAQTDSEGALPVIHACRSAEARSGEYYGPDGFLQISGKPTRVESSPLSHDEAIAGRLWTVSEELTKVKLL